MEEVRTYGPNVISFEVVTGQRRWYIIGCYIAPDDARTIERVVTALGDQPRGTALIVAGDFNTDLGEMASDGRGTEIAAAITEAGLEDMTAHFLPRKRRWGVHRRLHDALPISSGGSIHYRPSTPQIFGELVLPRGFLWRCQQHPSPLRDVSDVIPCRPSP